MTNTHRQTDFPVLRKRSVERARCKFHIVLGNGVGHHDTKELLHTGILSCNKVVLYSCIINFTIHLRLPRSRQMSDDKVLNVRMPAAALDAITTAAMQDGKKTADYVRIATLAAVCCSRRKIPLPVFIASSEPVTAERARALGMQPVAKLATRHLLDGLDGFYAWKGLAATRSCRHTVPGRFRY